MHAERRTIDLGWGSVSALTWEPDEPRDAPTVVLLHGGGLDNARLSWGGLGAAVADAGYRVYAPDHPGYGESPMPPWSITQDRLVTYVGEVLDALGLDSVILGGLSLGGGMSLGFVLRHPERVRGMMLFGSYGLTDTQVDGPLARPVQAFTWASMQLGALRGVTKAYLRNRRLLVISLRGMVRNPAELTPALVDEVVAEASRPHAMAAFEQFQRSEITPGRLRTNYATQLGEIRTPTLIVHGTHDSGVPVARAKAAAHALPNATLVIVEGAGHWVQRDQPMRVTPKVLDFLTRLA